MFLKKVKSIIFDEKSEKFAKSIIWSILGGGISRILTLFLSVFIARLLGKQIYGELSIIRTSILTFTIFASSGLGLTSTKYIAQNKNQNKILVSNVIITSYLISIILGIFIFIIVFFNTDFISKNILNAPNLKEILKWSILIIFITIIIGTQNGILVGFEDFKSIAKSNFISGILAFPIQIVLVFYYKLNGAIIGLLVGYIFQVILNNSYCQNNLNKYSIYLKFYKKIFFKDINKIINFSIPAIISSILVNPVMFICFSILINKPGGYGQMAIFDAANQWRLATIFIPSIISQIALPMLSDKKVQQSSKEYIKTLKINIIINSISAIIPVAILCMFSVKIMNYYGKDFVNEGSVVLIFLLLSSVMISVNGVFGQAIASIGKMWIGFLFNLIWAIIIITLSYFLINKNYGAIGLSIAFFISYCCHSIYQFIYIKLMVKEIAKEKLIFD